VDDAWPEPLNDGSGNEIGDWDDAILVPRASRPHASSLGPGTHRTGTARKLALISNAHGN
jgi:hypothetical protein